MLHDSDKHAGDGWSIENAEYDFDLYLLYVSRVSIHISDIAYYLRIHLYGCSILKSGDLAMVSRRSDAPPTRSVFAPTRIGDPGRICIVCV